MASCTRFGGSVYNEYETGWCDVLDVWPLLVDYEGHFEVYERLCFEVYLRSPVVSPPPRMLCIVLSPAGDFRYCELVFAGSFIPCPCTESIPLSCHGTVDSVTFVTTVVTCLALNVFVRMILIV